ncbi:unnamed protein product [Cyclocybe aegerita]|uniref:Uncharacterized protein n=1 Tax=Cyclocybe aegerita TaxID=1973307 RepID=A0A8S0WDX3_CYCAE|nr:unnamed protein product [Cyclocybe aegerita]
MKPSHVDDDIANPPCAPPLLTGMWAGTSLTPPPRTSPPSTSPTRLCSPPSHPRTLTCPDPLAPAFSRAPTAPHQLTSPPWFIPHPKPSPLETATTRRRRQGEQCTLVQAFSGPTCPLAHHHASSPYHLAIPPHPDHPTTPLSTQTLALQPGRGLLALSSHLPHGAATSPRLSSPPPFSFEATHDDDDKGSTMMTRAAQQQQQQQQHNDEDRGQYVKDDNDGGSGSGMTRTRARRRGGQHDDEEDSTMTTRR